MELSCSAKWRWYRQLFRNRNWMQEPSIVSPSLRWRDSRATMTHSGPSYPSTSVRSSFRGMYSQSRASTECSSRRRARVICAWRWPCVDGTLNTPRIHPESRSPKVRQPLLKPNHYLYRRRTKRSGGSARGLRGAVLQQRQIWAHSWFGPGSSAEPLAPTILYWQAHHPKHFGGHQRWAECSKGFWKRPTAFL